MPEDAVPAPGGGDHHEFLPVGQPQAAPVVRASGKAGDEPVDAGVADDHRRLDRFRALSAQHLYLVVVGEGQGRGEHPPAMGQPLRVEAVHR